MSCILFKNGESIRVEPEQLAAHFSMGWSVNEHEDIEPVHSDPLAEEPTEEPEEPAEAPAPEPESAPEPTPEPEPEPETTPGESLPENPEPDSESDAVELSPIQLRERAKEAGITNWDKAQLKTLRAKLGVKNE